MDSRQLRYFAAIHDLGSLTAAAEAEHVATSALSYHLSNLEAELGVKLFIRKPRGLEPTAAGARLYAHARAVLRALEDAKTDLSTARHNVSGEIAVGLAYSAVKAIGLSLARHVLHDFPNLKLSLTESLSGTTLTHLQSADVDLALVYNPPVTPLLDCRPLLEERMVLLGRPEIISNSAIPITAEQILDLPLILLRQGVSARALLEDSSLLKKLEARARLQMNSVHAIGDALLAGLGCAIGTELFMRERLETGEIISRPIVEPTLHRTLYLCQLTDRPPTVAREVMSELIVELVSAAVKEGRWAATMISGRRASEK